MQYLMRLHCQCRESNLETIASFSSINWKGNYFTWTKVYLSSPPLFTWLDITDVPSFFIRFHCHWITDFLWNGKIDKVHRFFFHIFYLRKREKNMWGGGGGVSFYEGTSIVTLVPINSKFSEILPVILLQSVTRIKLI